MICTVYSLQLTLTILLYAVVSKVASLRACLLPTVSIGWPVISYVKLIEGNTQIIYKESPSRQLD